MLLDSNEELGKLAIQGYGSVVSPEFQKPIFAPWKVEFPQQL